MDLSFALTDAGVQNVKTVKDCLEPLYADKFLRINQKCFYMQVPGVGSYYACDGKIVEYSAEKGADQQWVQLYLNNQVLVALLHQRKIISFHASSFIYCGRGVILLGETGAGKTSLTVAFTMNGAGFMSDDLTPVVFRENVPYIWALDRRVKLRVDSIEQLDIGRESLAEAESGTGKMYLHLEKDAVEYHKLDIIVKIETGDVEEPVFMNLSMAERFALLRSDVCSWDILAGMPETETSYMKQLVQILEQVRFVKVVRPPMITIAGMHDAFKQYLDSLS